ncbi:MAG: protease complex subunit PrcB family protein [Gemmatimonadota bacterium]
MTRTAYGRFGVALLVLTLGVACSDVNSGSGPEGQPLPADQVDTLVVASMSGFHVSIRQVINTELGWQGFWGEYQAYMAPAQPMPAIDFTKKMVIAASMGSRPTGGFSIRIESVLRNGDGYDVGIVETSPGSSCVVTQAVTAPVTAVAVPATDGDIHFFDRKTVHDCG